MPPRRKKDGDEDCRFPMALPSETLSFAELEARTRAPSQRIADGRPTTVPAPLPNNLPARPVTSINNGNRPRARVESSPPREIITPLSAYGHKQDKNGIWRDWYNRQVFTNPAHPQYGDYIVPLGPNERGGFPQSDHAVPYPSWPGSNLDIPDEFKEEAAEWVKENGDKSSEDSSEEEPAARRQANNTAVAGPNAPVSRGFNFDSDDPDDESSSDDSVDGAQDATAELLAQTAALREELRVQEAQAARSAGPRTRRHETVDEEYGSPRVGKKKGGKGKKPAGKSRGGKKGGGK